MKPKFASIEEKAAILVALLHSEEMQVQPSVRLIAPFDKTGIHLWLGRVTTGRQEFLNQVH